MKRREEGLCLTGGQGDYFLYSQKTKKLKMTPEIFHKKELISILWRSRCNLKSVTGLTGYWKVQRYSKMRKKDLRREKKGYTSKRSQDICQ